MTAPATYFIGDYAPDIIVDSLIYLGVVPISGARPTLYCGLFCGLTTAVATVRMVDYFFNSYQKPRYTHTIYSRRRPAIAGAIDWNQFLFFLAGE